jgi:thymidine kinase
MSNYGKLNLILGCMFSSKTSSLINRYNRYTIGGKRCLLIKHSSDTRYDDNHDHTVCTHDGVKLKAISCTNLYQVDNMVTTDMYDVVCVDEIQFYKDAHIYCDKWVNEGLIVEVCGLTGTFERKPFEIISKLIPMANNITFLSAVCKNTGEDANYSKRISEDVGDVVVGGADKYSATDRKTYFENISSYTYHIEKYREFMIDKKSKKEVEEGINYINSIVNLCINTKLDYMNI